MTPVQPAFFIPHGGGPCFFMPDPAETWAGMGAFLRSLPARLTAPPAAILLVSAHWETEGFRINSRPRPPLLYDYYGFPPETYALNYDAPGAPALADEAAALLADQGLPVTLETERGFDHGVFVPLKVAFPDAAVPIVEMSVERNLDPALHLAAGRALAPLRARGVLIIGSGMSFHDIRAFGNAQSTQPSLAFDEWLTAAVASSADVRAERLLRWSEAPGAAVSHPTAEHLIPLMVAAGTSQAAGAKIWGEMVMQVAVSAYRFD